MALRRRSRSSLRSAASEPADWWEGGSSGSIEEEGDGASEYGCVLNLGAESPTSYSPGLVDNTEFVTQWAQAGLAVPRAPVRRPSSRGLSTVGKGHESSQNDIMDRDCGICFEYAVAPCRTLCCGKIFCTEHLADWLHGPNAEGRCPNCENLCSLESSTLSLASSNVLRDVPSISRRYNNNQGASITATASSSHKSQSKPKPGVYPSSPLAAVQPHQNQTLTMSSSRQQTASSYSHAHVSSSSSSATLSSLDSDEDHVNRSNNNSAVHPVHMQVGVVSPSAGALSTTPFSSSWGAISRLMSIVTFLMFIYKLLS